jgi:hypothetical protein
MSGYAAGIRQHDTHRSLVGQGEPATPWPGGVGLDAIIVPGTRSAAHLDHAVTLARAAGCWLVILCSQQLRGMDVKEFLAARSFRKAIVVDVPAGYSHELLSFPGLLSLRDDLPPACGWYVTDLSTKRNIGLVMAKMLGWQRIFFLDDDIRDVTYPDLRSTVGMLESFSAVGMSVTDFPDNSIVCHANRMTGAPQDVFVSGAALAVDCTSDIGFFPDIYNEDWLFFFDAASNGKLGNSCLSATQLYYYPFANPQRASWQEFGDVLAEGLYALLHLGLDVRQATGIYWEFFLAARQNFLEGILASRENAHSDMREEIVLSVESALKSLLDIKPDLCADYVQLWRKDLRDWKRRVAGIPEVRSVEAALAELGLEATPTDSTWKILHPQDRVTPPRAAGAVSIPKFDTLREMAERSSNLGRLSPRLPDAVRSTLPLDVLPDEQPAPQAEAVASDDGVPLGHDARGRHRKLRPVLSTWRELIAGVVLRSAHETSAELGISQSEPETSVA